MKQVNSPDGKHLNYEKLKDKPKSRPNLDAVPKSPLHPIGEGELRGLRIEAANREMAFLSNNNIVQAPYKNEHNIYERMQNKLEKAMSLAKDQITDAHRRTEIAREIYRQLEDSQTVLCFSVDHTLKDQLIVKLVEKGSGEVKWQFPPEHSLELQKLAQLFPGLFLNQVV